MSPSLEVIRRKRLTASEIIDVLIYLTKRCARGVSDNHPVVTITKKESWYLEINGITLHEATNGANGQKDNRKIHHCNENIYLSIIFSLRPPFVRSSWFIWSRRWIQTVFYS